MKQYQGFTKHFFGLVTPLIASSLLGSLPTQAGTVAISNSVAEFTNFSQRPLRTITEIDTDLITQAKDAQAHSLVEADAFFTAASPTPASPTPASPAAFSSSFNKTMGQGKNFSGSAETTATAVGDFVIDADKPFSFDFTADLNLETKIDNPQAELAMATGDISFALIDKSDQSIIDVFSLEGYLETRGNNDFTQSQKSDNVTITNSVNKSNFGGNQESSSVSIEGSLQRSFANKTNFSLVEITNNKAKVTSVPEPSTTLVPFFCYGVIGIALQAKRKKKLQYA
jgi:hypothetical protein